MEDPFRDYEFDSIFCIRQLGPQKTTPKKVFKLLKVSYPIFSINTPCQHCIQKNKRSVS